MTPIVLLALTARPTRIPPIANILGIRVGYDSRTRLERHFGEGKYSIGGHPNSVETWALGASEVMTDGFAYSREGQVVEELRWSLTGNASAKGAVPKSKRWLGKISVGIPEAEALKIAATRLGKPKRESGMFVWTQRGWSKPSGFARFEYFSDWTASMSFKDGRVNVIDVVAAQGSANAR